MVLDEQGFRPPDERPKAKTRAGEQHGQVQSIYERLRDNDPHFEGPDTRLAELNPDSLYAAEDGWAVENNPYWPYVDSLTRDDVLPAEDSTEPSEQAAVEDVRRLILAELAKFSRDQRRAFTLHVLEDWSIEQIAAEQGRSPELVHADIASVRRALRNRLKEKVEET